MKAGILFDISRINGGSFQMSLNNLKTIMANLKEKNNKIIIIAHKNNLELKKLNLEYEIVKISIIDYFFLRK